MAISKTLLETYLSIVTLAILFFFSASLAGTESHGCKGDVIRSDNYGFEMELDVVNLDIRPENQNGFDRYRISIEGESTLGIPGMPELPHISRLIAVPPTACIELEWSGSEPIIIPSTPPVVIKDEDNSDRLAAIAPFDLSTTSGFWPPQVVELDKPAIMRGVRIVRVTVNPVQVDPVTGDLRVWENVSFRLNYTNGEAVNPVVNEDRPRPSRTADRLIRSLVVNPESIRRDQDRNGAYAYVIPDFDGVAEAIAPLVEWRKRQGYQTEIIVVAEDASNVQVKRAIENAYFEWDIPPEHVCLIGDADLQDSEFMIATWDVGRAYMWETDHRYAMLEGDDILPELAIGRISARRVNELERIVNEKIIPYEVEPYMENTEWYRCAALMSNSAQTGYSTIYLQRWLRQMLREVGFAEVDTFYFIHGDEGGHEFIEENFNRGISLFNYRGWGQFNGDWSVGDVDRDLENGRMLPFILMPTCNTGDFADHVQFPYGYCEDFLWGRRGGGIGSIGSSGFTHTNYNNVFSGGVLNSFYRDKAWQFGWALNQGRLELYRHFYDGGLYNDVDDPQVNNLKCWEAHVYQNNLIGDPATQLWTDIPAEMDVNHANEISLGENQLIVTVDDPEAEMPVSGAIITLLYEDELIRADETGSDGEVVFVFERGELDAGALHLTVTKHNMIPYLSEITVESAEQFLGVSSFRIDDDNADNSRGNGDENPNPGERIELYTYISNFGDNVPEGEIGLTLEGIVGRTEIISGEVTLDNAPDMGDSALATFVVDLAEASINYERVVLSLIAANEHNEWVSPLEFQIAAPDVELVEFSFDPEAFSIGDTVWVEVILHNEGQLISPAMSAELVSLQEAVVPFIPFADVDPIAIEEGDTLATARFRIYARDQAIPGTFVEMMIAMESEDGFRDETHFNYPLDTAGEGTPFGPDAHGYGCFDNTDETWDIAPGYEWVEIDPDLDGEGIIVDTLKDDLGNEQDWSSLVDLPFLFQYYGQEFDEITVCSNGWIAMGDESKISDFQNRRIPPALGPRAQICPFWDDLVNYIDDDENRIGGVYYWYDEENHRFIIEWSRMRRYIGLDGEGNMRQGGENTFQAILYDPQHYQTYTGDGDILFQYHTVHNDRSVDPAEFDTPYATVGIVNLNGTDGMEYTYWNVYHPGAAVLEDGRSIKFTTALIIVTGSVMGTVRDAATSELIEGAEIRGHPTSFGITDRDGEFRFDVLVGEGYSFTCWAPGYNEQTVDGIDIVNGRTVEFDFSLTHPDFIISEESVNVELAPDHATVRLLTISNTGNGPLNYRGSFDYLGGEDDELWQRMLDSDVTEQTGDDRILGAGFLNDHIWVTGSNGRDNPNKFYIFNRAGNLVRQVDQPTESPKGLRDVAMVGDIIYGGEREWIIGTNADGEVVDSIPGPLQIQRALAYDPSTETFWVANSVDSIKQINRNGEILQSFYHELDIYGLGFLPSDPDGCPLYIASRNKLVQDPEIPEALISKLNPVTGDARVVAVLEGDPEDRIEGMEIVPTFDPRKWVMLAIMTNAEGDRISAYDLGPSTNWISFEPTSGTIEPDGIDTLLMRFDAAGLDEGEYGLMVRFLHNARGLETGLPVILTVDPDAGIGSAIGLPIEFDLEQNHPNPFNAATVISFSLPEATFARISTFDITGREIDTVIEGRFEAGRHTALYNADMLPSGIYLVKLEAGKRSAFIKMALIR